MTTESGLEPAGVRHHMLRRTKGSLIYRRTKNLIRLTLRTVNNTGVAASLGALGQALNLEGTFAGNLLGTVVGTSFEQNGAADDYVRFADGTLIMAKAPVAGQRLYALAINNLNQFTGVWFDAMGAEHGFVALAVP
jgi:hypothetical protein